MVENGFYILDKSYADLIKRFNGEFDDPKSRPIYCCIEDRKIKGLYWLIPTSDLSHRTPQQIQKYTELAQVSDIRQAYYYIGHTTKPAIFKISKVLPVTDKYIAHEYKMQGIHLIMQDKKQISEIKARLQRILSYEALHPNKLEQKITTVKNFLCQELLQQEKENEKEKEKEIVTVPQNTSDNKEADKSSLDYQTIYEENEKRKQVIHTTNAILNEHPELKHQFIEAKKEYEQKHAKNVNKTQGASSDNTPKQNPKDKHTKH